LEEDPGGPSFGLRFTKKEGLPIHVVSTDEAEGLPVGTRRVDELGFYNLNSDDLADKVGLTRHRALALVWHLKLRENEDCYKEFRIGKALFKRFSQKAIPRIKSAIETEDLEQICRNYGRRRSS